MELSVIFFNVYHLCILWIYISINCSKNYGTYEKLKPHHKIILLLVLIIIKAFNKKFLVL